MLGEWANSPGRTEAPVSYLMSAAVEAPQVTPTSRLVMRTTNSVLIMLYAPPEGVKQQEIQTLIAAGDSPLPIAFLSTIPDVHLGKGWP